MRKILTTIVLFIMAMPVQAEGWREVCDSVGKLATKVMEYRQSGVSMSVMMGSISEGELSTLIEEVIISAYDKPRYISERMQRRVVEEFRDGTYLECVRTMRE